MASVRLQRSPRDRLARRTRALPCAALLAIAAAAPTTASADPYSVHAEASASVGWTDNTANTPEVVTAVGDNIPEAGFFTQLRPAVLLTYETLRTAHVTTAAVDINVYATEEPGNSYNGTLSYNGQFALTPVSELRLGTSLGFGRVDPLSSAQVGQGQGQGDSTFLSFGLSQGLNRQLSADLRAGQDLAYSFVQTTVAGETNGQPSETVTNAHNIGLTLSADHSWARASLGGTGSASFVITDTGGQTVQMINNLAATGRYDISPLWTSSAALGVSVASSLAAPDRDDVGPSAPEVAPTGSLSVSREQRLRSVVATFTASASHALVYNSLLDNITNTSTGSLSATVPLPWLRRGPDTTLQLSASLSASHSQPSLFKSNQTTWNAYNADGSLIWTFAEGLDASLRYQFSRTDVSLYMPPANSGSNQVTPPQDFFRHNVLVGVSGRFPARQAVQLPNRRILRVDEATNDESRLNSRDSRE
ncbi:MAG: hypothetical protein Tsb0020_42100 [Haliangiales bacterium]